MAESTRHADDILVGQVSHTATTAAATLITIPAGRTWVGEIVIGCSLSKAAGSISDPSVRSLVKTAGVGVKPAAGTILACEAKAGSNVATGLSGTQGHQDAAVRTMRVVAPAGNAVTLTFETTVANATEARADASAIGELTSQ